MIGYGHDELGLKLKHLIIDKLTIIYKGPVEVSLCFLEDLYETSNILTFLYELVQENSKLTCQGMSANLGELLFQYVL